MKILTVDDDELINDLVSTSFLDTNFELIFSKNGYEALKILQTLEPDVVLLDISLPDISGINVCEIVRKNPSKYGTPFIVMLTAHTDTEQIVESLEKGADEYIKKPFNIKELKSRIIALTRRSHKLPSYTFSYDENLIINDNKKEVLEYGTELILTKKEYDLLTYFIKNQGILLSRERILDDLWFDRTENIVAKYISKLKQKSKIISNNLINVKGFGYKLRESRN